MICRYKYVHVWKYICQSVPICSWHTNCRVHVPLHCEKLRISSPRCDNYEVHYVPGVPVNSEFIWSVGGTQFLCIQTYYEKKRCHKDFHAGMIPSPLLHIMLTKLGIWNGMSSLSWGMLYIVHIIWEYI